MSRVSLLCLLLLTACSTTIQHGLEERDANEVLTALTARGFSARKIAEKGKKGGWSIEVEDDRAAEALRVLGQLKLPRPERLKTKALTQTSSLVDSPFAERLRQLEAQEGDLEESLEALDGVASAAIELVVPPPSRLGQAATPSKASVLVRAKPYAVTRLKSQRTELQALVAAGVDGLSPSDVVFVIDAVTLDEPPEPIAPRDLRPLVAMLGSALSLLASLLAFVSWRLHRLQRRPSTPVPVPVVTAKATPHPRPIIKPVLQPKAAS